MFGEENALVGGRFNREPVLSYTRSSSAKQPSREAMKMT
jgi:hypothetical protein